MVQIVKREKSILRRHDITADGGNVAAGEIVGSGGADAVTYGQAGRVIGAGGDASAGRVGDVSGPVVLVVGGDIVSREDVAVRSEAQVKQGLRPRAEFDQGHSILLHDNITTDSGDSGIAGGREIVCTRSGNTISYTETTITPI